MIALQRRNVKSIIYVHVNKFNSI